MHTLLAAGSSSSPSLPSSPSFPSPADVSSLWSRVSSSPLLSHLNSLYVAMSSVGLLPPVCEQIHLGVVDAQQFRALMELLHTVGRQCHEWDAKEQTSKGGQDGAAAVASTTSSTAAVVSSSAAESDSSNVSSSSVDGGTTVSSLSLSPSSNSSQDASPVPAADNGHSPQSAHEPTLLLPPPSSSSSSSSSASSPSSSSSSSPVAAPSSSRARSVRSSAVLSPPPSARGERDVSGVVVERERFCKPSRLITVYPSKPFLITPIHLERLYVTSRKAAECMSDEEKAELATITVRWMGKPTAEELFLVATDVCALINIRKSNTAKTVAQFADGEKVSMPVHCSSGKGSSTHILTVLTLAGVRRLLTTSRSVLATSLLDYLTRIAVHLQHFPHYVPVNDPLKPTVTPLKPEQQTQLVANPAANGLSPPLMLPPSSSTDAQAASVSASSSFEPPMFASLPYSSDTHSVSSSSAGSAFLSPVAAVLSSSVTDELPDSQHSISSSNNSLALLPPPMSAASLTVSPADPSPPRPASASASALSGWAVKREHDEMKVDNESSEPQNGDRQKKRKVDDSGADAADPTPTILQQPRRTQYQPLPQPPSLTDNDSPIPLPLVDDSRTALYAATISRTMSNGQHSPSTPDSPSDLLYTHFHSSGVILPPLHYSHSPPFMATQPPALPFGEVSDLIYAPGPYHPPYYHPSRQHGYYLSPQHRPLTAPPMQPFTHHALAHHSKSVDDYASAAHGPQQTHSATSGLLHSHNALIGPAANNSNNHTTQQTAGGELTLPPSQYQPTAQHTQPATCCTHCQQPQQHHQPAQHSHGSCLGMYSNRRAAHPISPPPPPASYHTPYSHAQLPAVLPPHSTVRSSPHSHSQQYSMAPSSYGHSPHPTFHHARYSPAP